eukprot:CAMPEP_0183710032 /NCGR_PEP_ID=MMETSP0737-20130205/5913_1 /TAXON_ID=385413 /ORGANISM="Thalassiosira miniscula, Strain CCMP1093" /LENGTH=705 /DNA_ID=CAMNT_0025938255 /DNA_START=99 /DNA_END=2216 /DNA_ORIENTATION=+
MAAKSLHEKRRVGSGSTLNISRQTPSSNEPDNNPNNISTNTNNDESFFHEDEPSDEAIEVSTDDALAIAAVTSSPRPGNGDNHDNCNNINTNSNSVLETSITESQTSHTSSTASSSTTGRIYSFFDPSEIRKPPTSPASSSNRKGTIQRQHSHSSQHSQHSQHSQQQQQHQSQQQQPFDEGDDNASRTSVLSDATERIGNRAKPSSKYIATSTAHAMNNALSLTAAMAVNANAMHRTPTTSNHGSSSISNIHANNTSNAPMTTTTDSMSIMTPQDISISNTAAMIAAEVRPSSSAWFSAEEVPREVKYEEGATELFMLVEDAKWEEVCDRVEEEPNEARTWVVSSGTENTSFFWSVWRRLPLHEACRRQPPPVVIYSLLSVYPESSMAESNFGELPLHACVRCGACAEVVNCILASYPAAALARDNSGCTPLDILNGTGKMMDHDAVVAALNRTIAVLTKEELAWEHNIASMEKAYQQSKDKRRREYERIMATKNAEIEELQKMLNQEKMATSNLASKVIQTEQIVQDKTDTVKKYQEKKGKMEEETRELKASNATRKSKIKDLEDIVRSDRKAIVELNDRVQTLQASLISIIEDEETFASTKLAKAEHHFKTLMESQFVFLRETERKKDLLRSKVKQLGIKIPPKKKPNPEAFLEKKKEPAPLPVEEFSNNEVAEKAMASASVHLSDPNREFEDGLEQPNLSYD